MKKTLFGIIALLFCTLASAQEFKINHGPYLQNMGSDEVTVYFTTSKEAFSWVEVIGDKWTKPQRFATMFAGQYNAYNKENRVQITGLRPATKYRYRLVSKEITEYRPYKVTYGDSIATAWEEFTTFNPKQQSLSFVLMNDGHDKPQKVKNLLGKFPLTNVDMVIYLRRLSRNR
ncbi:MAG: fibronectin type III domain-containing protein, partial [Bacteroidaceae bacterium]|nr:fibronectin type III domain-containing protein [Bacteroidaceae bacterium]